MRRRLLANARERARPGDLPRTARPVRSGWNHHHLPMRGLVPQSDDGLVIARGKIRDKIPSCSRWKGFQGGSVGESKRCQDRRSIGKVLKESDPGRSFSLYCFSTLEEYDYKKQTWVCWSSAKFTRNRCLAQVRSCDWCHRGTCRLFRRDGYRGRFMQFSGRHRDRQAGPQWSRGYRARSRPKRI